MPVTALYNTNGDQVGEVSLKEEVFGVPVHMPVLHETIVRQLADRRRGTNDTKTRAEVRGGGKKPWRQKGTGRARHGSTRSPIWRGGGIIFGPHPRDYGYPMPRKVRRLALRSALSAKIGEGNLIVLDELKLERPDAGPDMPPKTRNMVNVLDNLKVKNALLVTAGPDDLRLKKSARNIPGIKFLHVDSINVYDLLAYDKLVITRDAVAKVEEVLA